jgi:hypothetical protein
VKSRYKNKTIKPANGSFSFWQDKYESREYHDHSTEIAQFLSNQIKKAG